MAKREMSNTLKNLKFMQRATQKAEKPNKKEEETEQGGSFTSPGPGVAKKCMVIVEGDPHPGAVRGRMSFQNFNPSLDKLNEETDEHHQPEASTSFSAQPKAETSVRESDASQNGLDSSGVDAPINDAGGEIKRKSPVEAARTPYPNKHQKMNDGNGFSSKLHTKEKLDFNVLRRSTGKSKK